MFKKLISTFCIALVLVAVLSACAPGAAASNGESSAAILHSLGLFQGTGAGADGEPLFELERAPTRAEAVTMLVRLLGADTGAEVATLPFKDVPDWARPYVGYAWENGLTNGTGADTFGSASTASAAHYISFALRALGYSSESDFRWDAAWEKSDALGLTSGQYGAGCTFTRGDVANISLAALYQPLKGSATTLAGSLCAQGAIKDEVLARELLGERAFTASPQAASRLELHFIDVGQADSILALCDGHAMLIDGGNVADSNLIYSYLQKREIKALDYVVCTHAHEDHVGGLPGALSYASVKTAYAPVKSFESKAYAEFLLALDKQGIDVTIPKAGESFSLGGANVTVLAPMYEYDEVNDSSIVLRIDHGERSFLLMGDAELQSEADILSSGRSVDADLIKIGHHGSESSSGYRLLYEASPQYAVISCGKNNAYGHPDEAVMSKLRDAQVKVYRTDMQGDVVCVSDGHTLSISTQKNQTVDTNPASPVGSGEQVSATYIGNINSKIFHRETCGTLPAEKNRVYFSGREAAVDAGYRPCGNCHP